MASIDINIYEPVVLTSHAPAHVPYPPKIRLSGKQNNYSLPATRDFTYSL